LKEGHSHHLDEINLYLINTEQQIQTRQARG